MCLSLNQENKQNLSLSFIQTQALHKFKFHLVVAKNAILVRKTTKTSSKMCKLNTENMFMNQNFGIFFIQL